jgi:hypothetical protein
MHFKVIRNRCVVYFKISVFRDYISSNCVDTLDSDKDTGDLLSKPEVGRVNLNFVRIRAIDLHIDEGIFVNNRFSGLH